MYEYECTTCGALKSKIVSLREAEEGVTFVCEDCTSAERDGVMVRVNRVYTPGHIFKGRWFKNTGSY